MDGERRQITVLFCDLVGSTRLATQLDPEDYYAVMHRYKDFCAGIVQKFDGFIARYIGDGVLVYFGYPNPGETDVERAASAALSFVREVGQLQVEFSDRTVALAVRVGMATGPVVIEQQDGTGLAFGKIPNLAARLQQIARPDQIVISEDTKKLLGGLFQYAPLPPQTLKGFDAPVTGWRLLGEDPYRNRFEALRGGRRTPFVGRDEELRYLRSKWHGEVGKGQGCVVEITGEAGIGKSRLVQEFANELRRDAYLLGYYCSPLHQRSTLYPVMEHMLRAAHISSEDTNADKLEKLKSLLRETFSEVENILPLYAGLLGLTTASIEHPYTSHFRKRLFGVLLEQLEHRSTRGKTVIVCEDMHWMDPTTRELVNVTRRRIETLPIMIVLTGRRPFGFGEEPGAPVHTLALGRLSERSCRMIVQSITGERRLHPAVTERVVAKTDGVPLFVEDLATMLIDTEASDPALLQGMETHKTIPPTLQDTLMERVSALGPRKTVAQSAAVLGRTFSVRLLAKVISKDVETTERLVKSLVDNRVLLPTLISPDTYSFRHALVQDAAYESLLREEKANTHARIADILVNEYSDIQESQPEILALHFDCCHDTGRAVEWYLKSGKRMNRVAAFLEAQAHLKRALELLTELDDTTDRLKQELELRIALGAAEAGLHGFSAASAGDSYERALEICRVLGDPPEIFPIISGTGSFYITRGAFSKCEQLAKECLERARNQTEQRPFVIGHRLLGGVLFLTGALEEAIGHLNETLKMYDSDPARYVGEDLTFSLDHKVTALCYLGLALCVSGQVDKGLEAGQRGLEHARALGNLHTINFSLTYLAAIHYLRKDDPETERIATESLELARREGFATWEGVSRMIRGEFLVNCGQVDLGLQDIIDGMRAHRSIEAQTYQAFGISLLVQGLMTAGKLPEAHEALERALELTQRIGEYWYHPELLRIQADLYLRSGKRAAAQESLQRALNIARSQGARLWELRCSTLLSRIQCAAGNEQSAVATLAAVYRQFPEGKETAPVKEARDCLSRMNLSADDERAIFE